MVNIHRKRGLKSEYKKIYIFCEGEKTEPLYFGGFRDEIHKEIRRKQIDMQLRGTGMNTLSLVKFAIDELKKIDFNMELDEAWVVFDKDSFEGDDFDNAKTSAESHGIDVAYSNECFELWYLLHFMRLGSAIGREEYYKKLSPLLGIKNYKKNGKSVTDIYYRLKEKQETAIKHARSLVDLSEYEGLPPSKKDPSTTVHLLVESLNNLK